MDCCVDADSPTVQRLRWCTTDAETPMSASAIDRIWIAADAETKTPSNRQTSALEGPSSRSKAPAL
jgi:hypothetical protein